jgi:multiple sugar transport system substrate-binding protein
VPLPADADQQREQIVRRLAARDSDIDVIGMDVIWTGEFATAG